ncbi:MAG: 2-oxoacid:acceptor oxidoreductase family protein [Deltaproteobacteria bacterium]|nr:2-oxoacid:acceptor oxidoreductase family protein [Deltaproteobacteria bacterium]MBW1984887.1 2-oxoacid:acceptor oxidoreductase family protein [Deltaproteobacteria bacterium]MBW2363662.1 2-oxoacid:acceptor oxidoreductase family protein [Deltaproteobacteria bacterium]
MQKDVMFAGFGGQGILLMGKILALAAMDEGREVTWVPSYGAEMRGGTANCNVVISDRPIGSPVIRNPMHLVVMNRPSLEKYGPLVRPKGVVLINSSLVTADTGREDIDELTVSANDIATEIGSIKSANIVALAAFVARSQLVDFELLRECVKYEFSKNEKLININMEALDRGRKAAGS